MRTLRSCDGCGMRSKVNIRLTNGELHLCNQCLGEINRKNPDVNLYRAALLRLAARADDYSAADVRACVADALGCTVGELEEME